MSQRIRLPKLHSHQHQLVQKSKRFTVMKTGRRYGKTILAKHLIILAIIKGLKCAYFAPTYKDLTKFWGDIKSDLIDAVSHKDEQNKKLTILTGGSLDCWSSDQPDSGRGFDYDLVIIDEAEKIVKLEYALNKTILPTLIDRGGSLWVMSTPNRLKNPNSYFLDNLCNQPGEDWITLTATTFDNPLLDREEIELMLSTMDELSGKQEIYAEDVTAVDRPFVYTFDEDTHLASCEWTSRLPTYLSFDFNVDPSTCLLAQHDRNYIKIIDEFRLRNSNTEEICKQIKAKYPRALYIVTGDATGRARSTTSNRTNYEIIKSTLGLNDKQIETPRSNPSIKDSRQLTNSLLANIDYKIDPRCKYLIEDLKYVQVKEDGSIDKGKDQRRTHLLDCLRYHNSTWFNWWLKN